MTPGSEGDGGRDDARRRRTETPARRTRSSLPRFKRRLSDRGHFLLLAGIVLVLAFTATAFTLALVSDLKAGTAREQEPGLLADYRFYHEHVRMTVRNGASSGMTNASALILVADASQSARELASSRGLELAITLAGVAGGSTTDEAFFGAGGWGGVSDYGGTAITGAYDGTNDGLVWLGGAGGRVQAVALTFYFADPKAEFQETILVALDP